MCSAAVRVGPSVAQAAARLQPCARPQCTGHSPPTPQPRRCGARHSSPRKSHCKSKRASGFLAPVLPLASAPRPGGTSSCPRRACRRPAASSARRPPPVESPPPLPASSKACRWWNRGPAAPLVGVGGGWWGWGTGSASRHRQASRMQARTDWAGSDIKMPINTVSSLAGQDADFGSPQAGGGATVVATLAAGALRGLWREEI